MTQPRYVIVANFMYFQASSQSSEVVLELDPEEPDTLIMTCMAGDVVGWRKFDRQVVNSKFAGRKISSPY